jgi:RNA polymerase sigma-70 factor, ECF subfamily
MVAEVQLRTAEVRANHGSRRAPDESPQMRKIVSMAVRRAQDGDRDALRFLYVRYQRNVEGYVRSIVHDDHAAEDVTQHVFTKLMTVLHQYDERAVPFFGWLLRLAHNAAIDHLRARRDSPVEEVHAPSASTHDDHDRARSLRAALETLPEDQRSVVVLRHVAGLSPAEIAERLGRSESSVHGLHHRGRRALQDELRRLDAAPSTVAAAR